MVITADQLAEVVKRSIDEGMANTSGWVLDGFPFTVEQANILVNNGIKPDFVLTLQMGAFTREFIILSREKSMSIVLCYAIDPKTEKMSSRAASKHLASSEFIAASKTFKTVSVGTSLPFNRHSVTSSLKDPAEASA